MPFENPNMLDEKIRHRVLQDIKSEDNRSRKREQQKRFDVYRERQDAYILERLQREFSIKTVNEMRKIFSINLTTRIIDEMSSVYNQAPERSFAKLEGKEVPDNETAQLESLYEVSKVNAEMRKSNRFYNLHDQCAIMVVPDMMGNIKVRAIPPMHYDVVPDANDPEKAHAYILNVWNFDLHKTVKGEESERTQLNRYRSNDRLDQSIADDNDRMAAQERYIVWTKDVHYEMDGNGKFISEPIPNDLQKLPFVDVADDKDFQYFVRRGTSVVDFALDFGLMLSDLSNIIRLQGYSQAVITSDKIPVNTIVGVNHVLWLQQDESRPELKPSFEFVSPNPDIKGSLEFLETTLRLFLSSRGIDPATISGKGEAKSFSSGIERLLSMLDKFEATRADYDLFAQVESEVYDLLIGWSNVFQSVTGEGALDDALRQGQVADDTFLDVSFAEPTSVQTQTEKEDSVIKLTESGYMSRKEGIMELRGVSEERAEQVLKEIDEMQEIEELKNPEPEVVVPPQEDKNGEENR